MSLTNSEDPDDAHNEAIHQGLLCFVRFKQSSATEMHHNLEMPTCDTLKYITDNPILIFMGKSIRIQRVS